MPRMMIGESLSFGVSRAAVLLGISSAEKDFWEISKKIVWENDTSASAKTTRAASPPRFSRGIPSSWAEFGDLQPRLAV